MNGQWKFTIGDKDRYSKPSYDDSDWETIYAPDTWENQGFPNYDGYGWYRKTFKGSQLQYVNNLILNLGFIDDVHEVYFNGELIGFKGSFPPNFYTAYDALNQYSIPPYLINKFGDNTIAIKVYDVYREGGCVKGDMGIYYLPIFDQEVYSLSGVWKFTRNTEYNWKKADFNDENWENILVPGKWREKYIKNGMGFGWYRKTFKVPKHLKGEELDLVLGYIDDFDVTYVNGEFVGQTKDNQRFGNTNSWQQLRIYRIPADLLNEDGENVIAIQVEDLGIDAGIYKGPIGLMKVEN